MANWRAFQQGVNTMGSQLAQTRQKEEERKQAVQDMFMKALIPELIKKQFPEAKEPGKYGIEALRFEKAKSKFKSQADALKPKKIDTGQRKLLGEIRVMMSQNSPLEDISKIIRSQGYEPTDELFSQELSRYRPKPPQPPQPNFMNRMAGGAGNILQQFNPFRGQAQ